MSVKEYIKAAALAEKEIKKLGYSIKEEALGNGLVKHTLTSIKKGRVKPTPVIDDSGNPISIIYDECPLNCYTALVPEYFLSRIKNRI